MDALFPIRAVSVSGWILCLLDIVFFDSLAITCCLQCYWNYVRDALPDVFSAAVCSPVSGVSLKETCINVAPVFRGIANCGAPVA
jgi:hypothetical protein